MHTTIFRRSPKRTRIVSSIFFVPENQIMSSFFSKWGVSPRFLHHDELMITRPFIKNPGLVQVLQLKHQPGLIQKSTSEKKHKLLGVTIK
jgi:hypothetical protein